MISSLRSRERDKPRLAFLFVVAARVFREVLSEGVRRRPLRLDEVVDFFATRFSNQPIIA